MSFNDLFSKNNRNEFDRREQKIDDDEELEHDEKIKEN